jgi:hypothetical protein
LPGGQRGSRAEGKGLAFVHYQEIGMKKCVVWLLVAVVSGVGSLAVNNRQAQAFPPFKVAFDKMYMTEGSALHKALEGKSNCNVCHLGTKDKKKRNEYGVALDKLLTKDDAKNPEKITEALAKVEAEKSGNATFGDLIKQGKLPITKDE